MPALTPQAGPKVCGVRDVEPARLGHNRTTMSAPVPAPARSEAVPPIRNVAVFCASADGVHPDYREVALELGRALAQRRIGVVFGGSKVGLMQAVAQGALEQGGPVVGVIPTVLVELEVAHDDLTELHITDTMHTRKAMMSARADAFIALPGGYGTFEELFEVLAWQTLKLHAKPVLLLNINGFYDPMLAFLDHCVGQGMLKQKNRDILLVAGTVEDALDQLGIPTMFGSTS